MGGGTQSRLADPTIDPNLYIAPQVQRDLDTSAPDDRANLMDALRKLGITKEKPEKRVSIPQNNKLNDELGQYVLDQQHPVPKGMVRFPNTEATKQPYGTGIVELDGQFFIVPFTKRSQNLEDQFRATGQHYGGFDNLDDALNYEREWLNQPTAEVGF